MGDFLENAPKKSPQKAPTGGKNPPQGKKMPRKAG